MNFCNIPWVSYTCKRQKAFFINLPAIQAENRLPVPRPALRQAESGGAAFQKSLAEFAARRRQIKCNPFSPGACTWAKILLSLQAFYPKRDEVLLG